MLRIKNYLFSMNKITFIKYDEDDDELLVCYMVGNDEETITIENATLDDIRLEEVL